MKNIMVCVVAILFVSTLARASEPVTCKEILGLFEKPEPTGIVFRCHLDVMEEDNHHYPTHDEFIEKLKTDYANNTNLSDFSEEEFIQMALPSLTNQFRSIPPKHERLELFTSKSNCYVRHFADESAGTPSHLPFLETLTIEKETHLFQTTRFDHRAKTISQTLETSSEYLEYFNAPFPANGLRASWNLYMIHPQLKQQLNGRSIPELLCESGSVKVAGEIILFESISTNNFQLLTSSDTTQEKWQYDLAWNNGPHIVKRIISGGLLDSEVQFDYLPNNSPNANEDIPCRITMTDKLQDTILHLSMSDIRQISPEEWNINAILNALMKKYSDYSYVQE